MTFSNPNSKPKSTQMAEWRLLPPSARWQALQTQLSQRAIPDDSPWMRRSRVISRWRVLADGSTAPAPRMA